MAKDKGAGIILYPEDIARIKRSVKPQYQFAVIWALSQYATEGTLPTEKELGEGGMVAFEFIFDKVRDALEAYKRGQQQRQEAIRKRWDTAKSENVRNDTTVYDRIHPNNSETKTETETVYRNSINNTNVTLADDDDKAMQRGAREPVVAFDGTDLTEEIRQAGRVDEIISQYSLPDNDWSRRAVTEDLQKYGEGRLIAALTEAANCNARGKNISVKYYRAILDTGGQKHDGGGDGLPWVE